MATIKDFVPLFDYSQWEIGIQSFFCDATAGGGLFVAPPDNDDTTRENWVGSAGQIAFFTAYQNAVFQKARPRVSLNPISYVPLDGTILDANGQLKHHVFNVPLEFVVVTQPDYLIHCQTLALVRATALAMAPVLVDPETGAETIQTTGLNAFLTNFEMSRIVDPGNTLAIGLSADKGAFVSTLHFDSTFAVRASAWPATNQSNP